MNNFGRVLKICLRYRLTVAASVLCALSVAVLWVANLGTVYPFVEVVFRGQSLREWSVAEIDKSQKSGATLAAEIAELEAELEQNPSEDEANRIAANIGMKATEREAEQRAVEFHQWLQPYIYNYLPEQPFQTLLIVVAFLLVGTMVKALFLISGTVLVERVSHLGTLDLRKEFYRRSLRMDLGSFNESGTSELITRFTHDMECVANGVRTVFGRAVREPLKMIACFVGAAWICWRLLILSLVVAPLAAYLITKLSGSIRRANRRALTEMSGIYNNLAETFRTIKLVKACTMERHERRKFHDRSKEYYLKSMKIARYDAMVRPATELMGILTICLAIIAGAYLVLNQETHLLGLKISDRALSPGLLLLFYTFLAGVSDPGRKLSDVFAQIQRAAAASDRIYELLDREPAIQDPPAPKAMPRHQRAITFENIHFDYGDSQPVLNGVDLTIPYGEAVALVGPNGSGKSTLANLIPRFYDPVDGSVKIDGVDLHDARIRDIRDQIGIVTQETLMFNDTVWSNICYGAAEATRDEVLAASKQAHADSFIRGQLEDGYDTIVGEQGSRLSGGQRQRIALARAILRDPSILILDEATSQIDLESQQVIHDVLADFIKNRTTVFITHRRATLDLVDRIIVMDAGRIADSGTHEELVERCEVYRRLFQIEYRESA